MTTELRTSQVEVLGYIDEGSSGRTMTECAARFGYLWAEMWRELCSLYASGHVIRHGSRWLLTQLGHEALEGSDA